jgi:hypothetical protein
LYVYSREDPVSSVGFEAGVDVNQAKGYAHVRNGTGEPIDLATEVHCETGKGIDHYNQCAANRGKRIENHLLADGCWQIAMEPESPGTTLLLNVKAVSQPYGAVWFLAQISVGQVTTYLVTSGPAAPIKIGPQHPKGPESDETRTVENEIAKIRAGAHAAMPAAQAAGAAPGAGTSIVVKNDTQFDLSVYYAGPVSRSVQIAPKESRVVSLPAGPYQVAAKVSDPSVIPFYGTESYSADTQYSVNFYIAPMPR